MSEVKNYIDIVRLGEYDALLKAYIEQKFLAVSNKIGTVPSTIGEGENEQAVANLVDYINKSVALANSDASALELRVKANEDAIGNPDTIITATAYAALSEEEQAKYILIDEGDNAGKYIKGAAGLYKYIDDAAAAAIAKVVAGEADYTTLELLEGWIKNTVTGAAGMQNAIKVLQGTDGSTQTKTSASIPGVKLYIDSLVGDKNATAEGETGEAALIAASDDSANKNNKVTVASTQKLKDAVVRAEDAVLSVGKADSDETYVALSVNDGDDATVGISDAALNTKIGAAKNGTVAASGMYADMQGATNTTTKGLNDKVGELKAVGTASPATVIAYIDEVSKQNTANLQGNTEETLASVEAKYNLVQVADADSVAALFPTE